MRARSASEGYVDFGRATANALAGASGSYLLDAAATRTAKGDGHSWPVVFGEECQENLIVFPEKLVPGSFILYRNPATDEAARIEATIP